MIFGLLNLEKIKKKQKVDMLYRPLYVFIHQDTPLDPAPGRV